MTAAIQLNGLVKSRGDFQLGPLDITVEGGLIVALVGPNGSGKSTLFRLLTGLLQPEQGEVKLFGERAYPDRDVEVKSRLGFAGDSVEPLDDRMTVEEWKAFVSRWYVSWNEEIWSRLYERLELPGKKKLKQLSTGMAKRLSFALALSHDPDLLLLDEPSSGLDPFAWRIMLEEIRRFMDTGERTTLIATHVMEEVRRLADLIVFLHRGRIVGVYEKDQLLEDWKTMWLNAPASSVRELPGVILAEDALGGGRARVVTSDARRTEAGLRSLGIVDVETKAVELDDILWHLMERNKQGSV